LEPSSFQSEEDARKVHWIRPWKIPEALRALECSRGPEQEGARKAQQNGTGMFHGQYISPILYHFYHHRNYITESSFRAQFQFQACHPTYPPSYTQQQLLQLQLQRQPSKPSNASASNIIRNSIRSSSAPYERYLLEQLQHQRRPRSLQRDVPVSGRHPCNKSCRGRLCLVRRSLSTVKSVETFRGPHSDMVAEGTVSMSHMTW